MARKTLLDEISALDHLHFSKRVRRRVRRRQRRGRLALGGWMLMGVLAIFGIQASDPTLEFVQAIERTVLGGDTAEAAQAGGVAVTKRQRERSASRDRVENEPNGQLPTPTPSPSPSPSGGEITRIIMAAATEFGIDPDYMLSIAECESTFNPNAYHPAGYHGLFQFDYMTWGEFGYGSIYDPVAQARTTAKLLADGESDRWPVCGLR